MESVLTQDIVYQQLTNHMWESRVAQIQQERHKNQKDGVVYVADVDRDISCLQELIVQWETNLNGDQMGNLLFTEFSTTAATQLILRTKRRKEAADRDTPS
jgi:hypothetical protein